MTPRPTTLHPTTPCPTRRPMKVGLLMPCSGAAGIWAPSCEASAMLAAGEISADGGILGRMVELVPGDAGTTDYGAACAASDLAELDRVEIVVGMVTSSAREAVARALRSYRVPFIYTPQSEDHRDGPGVLAVGETASDLLRPAVAWLGEQRGATRFFLLGNDYRWPIDSIAQARRAIADLGGMVVDAMTVPMGWQDHGRIFSRIAAARPDVVVTWLLGQEAVSFHRAFARAGLAGRFLRLGMALDETILLALGEENTENLYASAGYFRNIASSNNAAFLERYHDAFGVTPPPPNCLGQSLYKGLYGLAGLANAAQSLAMTDLRRLVGRAPQEKTARAMARKGTAGRNRDVYLAMAHGSDFEICATFPSSRP